MRPRANRTRACVLPVHFRPISCSAALFLSGPLAAFLDAAPLLDKCGPTELGIAALPPALQLWQPEFGFYFPPHLLNLRYRWLGYPRSLNRPHLFLYPPIIILISLNLFRCDFGPGTLPAFMSLSGGLPTNHSSHSVGSPTVVQSFQSSGTGWLLLLLQVKRAARTGSSRCIR